MEMHFQSNAVGRPCLTEVCEVSEQSEGRDWIRHTYFTSMEDATLLSEYITSRTYTASLSPLSQSVLSKLCHVFSLTIRVLIFPVLQNRTNSFAIKISSENSRH